MTNNLAVADHRFAGADLAQSNFVRLRNRLARGQSIDERCACRHAVGVDDDGDVVARMNLNVARSHASGIVTESQAVSCQVSRYDRQLLRHFVDVLVALGPLGILVLALVDSVVPIAGVFDVLIAVVASQRPTVGWWCAVCAVIGSTAGNYVLFQTARRGGRRYLDRSSESMRGRKFRVWFERYGLITVFIPALLPIPMPLKLFVISAGALGTGTRAFLLVVIVARTLRYFGEAWLGVNLGKDSEGFLRAHGWHFLEAAVMLFVALYAAVSASDKWRRRAG